MRLPSTVLRFAASAAALLVSLNTGLAQTADKFYAGRTINLIVPYGPGGYYDDRGGYCRPEIESVELAHGRASGLRGTGLRVSALSSFGQDAQGHVYLASLNGPVYRLAQG